MKKQFKNFEEWALYWYRKFKKDYCMTILEKNIVIGRTIIANKYTRKISIAYCNTKDEFDDKIGAGVAYAKYKGVKQPSFYIPFFEYLKNTKEKYFDCIDNSNNKELIFIEKYSKNGFCFYKFLEDKEKICTFSADVVLKNIMVKK